MARALVLADEAPYIPLERLLDQPLDVVLCLGDLRQNDLEALERAALPKFGVHGNHDDGDEFVGLGIEDLHLRCVEVAGLTFGGFSGAHRNGPKGPYDWSQRESERMLRGFGRVDVMIAHSPPLGVNDDADDPVHVGLSGLRLHVERCRRCSCTATPTRRCRWSASARPRFATCAVTGSSTCPCADVGHPTMHASWAAATRGREAWRGAVAAGDVGHAPAERHVLVVPPASPAPLAGAQPAPGGVLGLALAAGKGGALRPCQASACITANRHRTHRRNHWGGASASSTSVVAPRCAS